MTAPTGHEVAAYLAGRLFVAARQAGLAVNVAGPTLTIRDDLTAVTATFTLEETTHDAPTD